MRLDPDSLAHLRKLEAGFGGVLDVSRLRLAERLGVPPIDPGLAGILVDEWRIGGSERSTAVRLYRDPGSLYGLLVYLHGGGFISGNLDTHDDLCRRLSRGSGCAVLAIDYRLAPEHAYPAPLEDGWIALQWAAAHQARWDLPPVLAIGGDSAGGLLAAMLAIRARDAGGPTLKYQLLLCPMLDDLIDPATEHLFPSGRMRRWFREQYRPDDASRAAFQTPASIASLRGLPPCFILAAGHDPMRHQAEHYATRLHDDGVKVDFICFDSTIHNFFCAAQQIGVGRIALDYAADTLRRACQTAIYNRVPDTGQA